MPDEQKPDLFIFGGGGGGGGDTRVDFLQPAFFCALSSSS